MGLPKTAEDRTAQAGASALAARWSERDGESGTRRDAVLRRIAAAREAGATPRPDTRDLRGIRLNGENLSGIDLSGCDLSDADLSGADLSGARLARATLCRAVLFGADLSGAELLSADLSGADLTECKARRAGFGAARLSGATLFQADLRGATLTRADLRGADLRTADLRRARLREAELGDADLTRARLRGASLEQTDVRGAAFVHGDLRSVRMSGVRGFDGANWIGVDVLGANFCGAYMARRFIEDQNYIHEFRTRGRLNTALYWLWWVTSDCGRSFARWGLWTILLALVFAALYQTVDVDYGDHPTFLSSVYYSVVTLTTLGYGDAVPASPAAQVLAMIEVAVGYVMLGGLLSIFANKMARRAG